MVHPDIFNAADDVVIHQYLSNPAQYIAMAKIAAEIQAPKNLEELGWIDDEQLIEFEETKKDMENEGGD